MKKSHGPYPVEFRQQMVELVRAGKTPKQLSQEFGCCADSIINWVAKMESNGGKSGGKTELTSSEREELARLRRENRQLKLERDILAKATAWFAAKGEKMFNPSSSL